MSMSSDGILVYGLALDDAPLDRRTLAQFFGYDTSATASDHAVYNAVEDSLKKRGLSLVIHGSYEDPLYIIGCGVTQVSRGSPACISDLPRPTERQAETLLNLKNKFGGKLGVWLCSLYG